MGQLGHGRLADHADDGLGLLARFDPDDVRTARALLHPRLTLLPCPVECHESLMTTLSLGVDVRIVCAADLVADPLVVANREHDRLASERAALCSQLEVPRSTHQVRTALHDYEIERQRGHQGVDTKVRLSDALEQVRAEGDLPLDSRARRWLATQELSAHYARQHLDAITTRIEELERRRARTELVETPPADITALLRWIVTGAPEQLVVLVELVDPTVPDMLDALVAASSLRRIVYVTGDPSLLRRAAALPADVGAVRDVLVTDRPTVPA